MFRQYRAVIKCHFFSCRATTEQCPFAVIVMCLQSIFGVIIQACMAGIIFAKFTVPRARGQTIIFSKNGENLPVNSMYLVLSMFFIKEN